MKKILFIFVLLAVISANAAFAQKTAAQKAASAKYDKAEKAYYQFPENLLTGITAEFYKSAKSIRIMTGMEMEASEPKFGALHDKIYNYLQSTASPLSVAEKARLKENEKKWQTMKAAFKHNVGDRSVCEFKGDVIRERCFYLLSLTGYASGNAKSKRAEFALKAAEIERGYITGNVNVSYTNGGYYYDECDEYERVYKQWHSLLKDLYAYHQQTMLAARFKSFKDEQNKWRATAEALVNAEINLQNAEDFGEPTYIASLHMQIERQRAYYLIYLIK